jgi:hypothetical protein
VQFMKKIIIAAGMMAFIIAVCVFSNISELYLIPLQTPAEFLSSMPYKTVAAFGQEFILIQPSSTFIVYFLGVMMLILGAYFLKTKKDEKSRYYLGIGFIIWGISAIVAGTSYQAFGYELKCRGQEFCLFTSNWELVYMLLTAYCINCLMIAMGYGTVKEKGRKLIIKFAVVDSIAYSFYMLIGCMIPNRFIISYEGFVAFIGINFVIMFIINIHQYAVNKDRFNRNMIIIWIAFIFVNAVYFIYLYGGFAAPLYSNYGIWFNANDVLHVLLIAWACLFLS